MSAPASPAELASALRPLAERATPGPWYVVGAPWGNGTWVNAGHADPHGGRIVCDCEAQVDCDERTDPRPLDDAAYIAACSPERVLALCEAVERSIDIDGFVGWLGSGSNATGAFPLTLSDLDRALWEYAFLRAATPTPEDR